MDGKHVEDNVSVSFFLTGGRLGLGLNHIVPATGSYCSFAVLVLYYYSQSFKHQGIMTLLVFLIQNPFPPPLSLWYSNLLSRLDHPNSLPLCQQLSMLIDHLSFCQPFPVVAPDEPTLDQDVAWSWDRSTVIDVEVGGEEGVCQSRSADQTTVHEDDLALHLVEQSTGDAAVDHRRVTIQPPRTQLQQHHQVWRRLVNRNHSAANLWCLREPVAQHHRVWDCRLRIHRPREQKVF